MLWVVTEIKNAQEQSNKQQWEESQVVTVLFGSGYGAVLGNLMNISIVAYVLSDIYPGKAIFLWLAFGITLNLIRWWVLQAFSNNPSTFENARWLNIYRGLTLVSGIHFGVLALLFFNSNEPLYQALVIFMVGGSASAAVGTHGADFVTYRLFIYPSVLPLIVRSLAEQTDVHNALALMLGLLVMVMLRAARQTRDTLRENIIMSYTLNYRATHDPLVALLNREEFQRQFEVTKGEMAEGDVQAIIFIDLNNFKTVNDTYGHQAGDEALVEVSNIIRSLIRKSDIAARFGGDEFIILMRARDLSDIEAVGQKIIDNIALYAEHKSTPNADLGASLGIGYTTDAETPFDILLRVADQACYKAKRDSLTVPFLKESRANLSQA